MKALAKQIGLPDVAVKKESMGICFIGKRKFSPFLQDYLTAQPGPIKHVDGKLVGQHNGVHFHTLGQGAGLASRKSRLFVVGKHVPSNTLYVDDNLLEPSLAATDIIIGRFRWTHSPHVFSSLVRGEGLRCAVRTRHRHPLVDCVIHNPSYSPPTIETPQQARPPLPVIGYTPDHLDEAEHMWESLRSLPSTLQASLTSPGRAVAPGQVAAVYQGRECVGGGVILAVRTAAMAR